MLEVTAYVDGACTANGKKGAKAGIGIYFVDDALPSLSARLPTTDAPTNNRAELFAILVTLLIVEQIAIKARRKIDLTIYGDSEYAAKSVTIFVKQWKLNGFMTKSGSPVKNSDLIVAIDRAMQSPHLNVVIGTVRSHGAEIVDEHADGNDRADILAKEGVKEEVMPELQAMMDAISADKKNVGRMTLNVK